MNNIAPFIDHTLLKPGATRLGTSSGLELVREEGEEKKANPYPGHG